MANITELVKGLNDIIGACKEAQNELIIEAEQHKEDIFAIRDMLVDNFNNQKALADGLAGLGDLAMDGANDMYRKASEYKSIINSLDILEGGVTEVAYCDNCGVAIYNEDDIIDDGECIFCSHECEDEFNSEYGIEDEEYEDYEDEADEVDEDAEDVE